VAKAETNIENTGGASNVLANIASWPARLKEYFEDLKSEMHKVTWPSWNQVRATTAVVIAAVFGFAFYFMLVDLVLGRAIQRVFEMFTK